MFIDCRETENNLEHLDLSFNPLGSEGTSALNRAISSGRCLRELNLSNCSIDFAGASCFLSVASINLWPPPEICNYLKNTGCGVQSLDLSYNFITEGKAFSVLAFSSLCSPHSINSEPYRACQRIRVTQLICDCLAVSRYVLHRAHCLEGRQPPSQPASKP